MSISFGVNDYAVKTQSAYIGVKNTAHKILKMYIGVNGKAQLFYDCNAGDSGGGDSDSNGRTYLYNNGDECTTLTGGWIGNNDSIDGITCKNQGSYLMIKANNAANGTWTSIASISTVNTDCVPFDNNHILYIEYSLISTEVNNRNCYMSVQGMSGAGGTAFGGEYLATSSSVETVYTATIQSESDYGNRGVNIQLALYGSEIVEVPNTTLKVYRVWYESNETT